MKLNDVGVPGTLKDLLGKRTPSFDQVMNKHKITREQLQDQLTKGIEVEKEHTSNAAQAREIALDHLAEFPDYYDRLDKMEQKK